MKIFICDRCGRDCYPFTTNNGEFFEVPPRLFGKDLCESCYTEIMNFVRHMPRWREFHDGEYPEIGQKIILNCPDVEKVEVITWLAENQRTYDGGGYRIFRWKPWREVDTVRKIDPSKEEI